MKSSGPQVAKETQAAKAADAKLAAAAEKAEIAAEAAAAAAAAAEAAEAAAAARLLNILGGQERQFWSLNAYSDARSYVQRAEADFRVAARSLEEAMAVWRLSKIAVLKALAAERAAVVTVGIYKEALTQLGLAVYTGAATAYVNDITDKENQLAQTDMAGVAATATTAGLKRSEVALALSIVKVRQARATVVRDWASALRARGVEKSAIGQVSLSRKDMLLARDWAVVPGEAPAQPVQALALLEGKFAPPQSSAVRLAARRSGTGSSPVTALASVAKAETPTPVPNAPNLQDLFGYGPSILGPSLLSAEQISGWFETTGYRPRTTVPFSQLVADYMKAGELTGVRPDVAFAQSVIETAYFSFPGYGQDAPGFNNFAGIGACDTCKHGWHFPSAMTGVLSQQELLAVYATPPHPTGAYGGPTSDLGIAGCCTTWMALAGTWASSPAYGFDILTVYNDMLSWALPGELRRLGLVPLSAPASPPAKPAPAPSRSPRT